MAKQLYQHFNPSEYETVEKILDLVDRLETYYCHQLTGFLDPRQQEIAHSILRQAGVRYYSSQDYYPLEQARFILAPDYYQLEVTDFEMALVEISYQGKFAQLSHSQILGSLLNGLGLKRQVIGDIIVAKGYAQVVLDQQMADYAVRETRKMARTGVQLRQIDFEQLIRSEEKTETTLYLVSSLRLDKLVALLTGQSRQQAQVMITSGKVKVNHRESLKVTQEITIGDLLSIRGSGRYRLTEHIGISKSGKHKVMIAKIVNS
ncbi:YlmH family RNA-binding protein [Streptococcus entericus]|uniref:YlmH family RNA-binding protein n=1 Tax=Streptococcus entericus TaxID=155680 RepID=UPI000366586D|nr:YlmH/Sll1252 family protein [Streptococcus entericus]